MYSRLHCQLSESLPLDGCSTFLIPAAHLQVQQVILCTQTHLNTTLLKRKKVFFSPPPRCCESKTRAFAYSPLLSQSVNPPFDLLFIWLSLCITTLFTPHFNIWWGHLWCRVSHFSGQGVVSVCALSGFIVGSATFSALTPWELFDPKSKRIQTFACVPWAVITRPFSGLHYERTRTYLLCSRRRWLLSSRMCYLFHNNLICYPSY